MSYVTITQADAPALSQLRSRAKRAGWRIEKARGELHSNNRGGLQLIDENNTVRYGVDYDLTVKVAAEIVDDILAAQRR